jgi:hypothetical protein
MDVPSIGLAGSRPHADGQRQCRWAGTNGNKILPNTYAVLLQTQLPVVMQAPSLLPLVVGYSSDRSDHDM